MRSSLISLDYWYEYCSRVFPEIQITPLINYSLPELAGFAIAGTNTFFVNGGEDPWRWAAVQESNKKLHQIARVADCDNCGHCVELYTPKDSDP